MTKPQFALGGAPRSFSAGETRPLVPDCCTDPVCNQRDYNRALLLLLDRMVQAYAGFRLAEWSTALVWACADDGHTINCPDPGCTFGREQAKRLGDVRRRFEQVSKDLFAVLSIPACDLSAQWEGFVEIEQAAIGLEAVAHRLVETGHPGENAYPVVEEFLDVWRQEVVGFDDDEYSRWFTPPNEVPDDAPA